MDVFEKFYVDYKNVITMLTEKEEITIEDTGKAGIYALYLTNYINDWEIRERLVLPIYIGQSKNLWRRKNEHLNEINHIIDLPEQKINNRLKKHREQGYLYFKIRNCIEASSLNIDNISIKCLEYCDINELNEREQYYIQKYCGIEYGFNQFETIQKCFQFKENDEYYETFLLTAKRDFLDCIQGKYVFGFCNFNMKNLCFNTYCVLKRMSKCKTESEYIMKLHYEFTEIFVKMQSKYFDYSEYTDLSFVYDELKI